MPKHVLAYMTISSLAFLMVCRSQRYQEKSNFLIPEEDTWAMRLEQSHPKMGALRNKKI